MNKIAEKVRSRARAPRTGVAMPGMVYEQVITNADGSVFRQAVPPPYGAPGDCKPQASTRITWGGGSCPSCSPEDLPAALGRAFAGEASGCRELLNMFSATASADGTVVISGNSPVTVCPTRLLAYATNTDFLVASIKFGNQEQLLLGDPIPAAAFATEAWGAIPFVMNCLKSGMPYTITLSGCTNGVRYDIGLIGPTIG